MDGFELSIGFPQFDQAVELEQQSYPPDESANRSKMEYRWKQAPSLQMTLLKEDRVVGLIMATASQGPTLTEESMKSHDPNGRVLCIHSVVIHPSYRGSKLGQQFLSFYLVQQKATGQFERAAIICHQSLVSYYQSVGFISLGPSTVSHGLSDWIDMIVDF
jgi:arylalkylamine N-acetyltransferase